MSYTLEQLNAIDRFSELVEELESASQDLLEQLHAADVEQARAFDIPRVPVQEEHLPQTQISVAPLHYEESVSRAFAALKDWYGVSSFSTKLVHRTPGAICVKTDNPRPLIEAIERCNDIKSELQLTTPALGSRNDRFELIHARHHMMVLTQLTRRCTALLCPPEIKSVTFSWGVKTEIKKMTIDEACSVLEAQKQRRVADEDGLPWEDRVDQEINRLRSLPAGTLLRQRRPRHVRPLANIRFVLTEQEKDDRRQAMIRGERVNQPTIVREAHTPIIIINPAKPVTIGDLAGYTEGARSERKKRAGKITADEPLTTLAPIYAVIK